MTRTETHIVPERNSPVRLSDYAGGIFTLISSRKGMKKAIDKGWVRINGRPANTADRLCGGERIELTLPPLPSGSVLEMDIPVLYEDDHLAVVVKPAGLQVNGNRRRTVEHALGHNLSMSRLADATAPCCVHRLDRLTTGCLLVGKTRDSVARLSAMFADGQIAKEYFAVAIGNMPPQGSVSSPVDDKPSYTEFEVVRSVKSVRYARLNLVKVRPHTGRRHQIRIHLSSIGHPILGDRQYGTEGLILKGKGLFLHAHRLSLLHPHTNERVETVAPLPRKFVKLFP